jgi:hypothetical protein
MSRRRVIAPQAPTPSYNVLVFTPELGVVIDSVVVDDARAEVVPIGETVVVKRVYKNDQAVLDAVADVELI